MCCIFFSPLLSLWSKSTADVFFYGFNFSSGNLLTSLPISFPIALPRLVGLILTGNPLMVPKEEISDHLPWYSNKQGRINCVIDPVRFSDVDGTESDYDQSIAAHAGMVPLLAFLIHRLLERQLPQEHDNANSVSSGNEKLLPDTSGIAELELKQPLSLPRVFERSGLESLERAVAAQKCALIQRDTLGLRTPHRAHCEESALALPGSRSQQVSGIVHPMFDFDIRQNAPSATGVLDMSGWGVEMMPLYLLMDPGTSVGNVVLYIFVELFYILFRN